MTTKDAVVRYKERVALVYCFMRRRGHDDADAKAKLLAWGVPEAVVSSLKDFIPAGGPSAVSDAELEQTLTDAKSAFWDAIAARACGRRMNSKLAETRAQKKAERKKKEAELLALFEQDRRTRNKPAYRYPRMPRGQAKERAPKKVRRPFPKGRIVATYQYVDHTGALLYETVRFEPKDFRLRRPGTETRWVWNLNGIGRVLYRLPSVMAMAERHGLVIVTEGEKDADAVSSLGLCATTCSEGAGAWIESYSETLVGAALVAVIQDNDKPGRIHARQVARSLARQRIPVKIVALPDDVKDSSEFLNDGGTVRSLLEAIRHAPQWKSEGSLLDYIE